MGTENLNIMRTELPERVLAHTNQIRDISNQPNSQERKRYALRTPRSIIQDKLRYLKHHGFNQPLHFPILISSTYLKLTNKKIHVAKEILPKTPDKPS